MSEEDMAHLRQTCAWRKVFGATFTKSINSIQVSIVSTVTQQILGS
jgi:hypothetical protein